jgi:hypothetical protein
METEFKTEPIKAENEKGYIKLMKNETSKGVVSYNWDIKAIEGAENNNEAIKKLVLVVEELNDQMGIRFGRHLE